MKNEKQIVSGPDAARQREKLVAQVRSEVVMTIQVTEKEFSLICHALTGSSRMPEYLEAAKELGRSLMTQTRNNWAEKLRVSEHALEIMTKTK